MWGKSGNTSVFFHCPLPCSQAAAGGSNTSKAVASGLHHWGWLAASSPLTRTVCHCGHLLILPLPEVGPMFLPGWQVHIERMFSYCQPLLFLYEQTILVWVMSQNSTIRIFIFSLDFFLSTENCLQFATSSFLPQCPPNLCFSHKIFVSVRAWDKW